MTAARAVRAHKPQLLIADGQGALIALGLSKPLVLESALAMRNIHITEALQIAKGWGCIKGVLLQNPRVAKHRLDLAELRLAVPELFNTTHPWVGPKTVVITDRTAPL